MSYRLNKDELVEIPTRVNDLNKELLKMQITY